MTDTLLATIVAQIVLPIVATITTALIGWAAAKLRARWGIEIEAAQREALHQALMTGAQLALTRRGRRQDGRDLDLLARDAVAYAQTSVPDAIQALAPRDGVLKNLAAAKIATLIK